MRVLFTTRPARGHFHPLVPLARAVAGTGHEVAFATGDGFCDTVRAAGFECFRAGIPGDRYWREFTMRFGELDRIPRSEFRSLFFGQVFTDFEVPARAADLQAVMERWQPDLLVHGLAEFAGPLVAARAGIPHATCGFGPLPGPEVADVAGAAMAPHWQAAGLDPRGGALYRSLYLDPCPPSLQVPEITHVAHAVQIRPEPADGAAGGSPPRRVTRPLGPRTVYLTFGTIFNRDLDVLGTVLRGLATGPVNVIVTLGDEVDPAVLGRQPDNVRVLGYLPQAELFGVCDVVVCHAGASTVFGALAFGLPLLLLPRGADNFYNADRVLAAGAGRRLLDSEITAEAVAGELAFLLEDVRCRAAAALIAGEIAAMPAPATAVGVLEELAGRRRRGAGETHAHA